MNIGTQQQNTVLNIKDTVLNNKKNEFLYGADNIPGTILLCKIHTTPH